MNALFIETSTNHCSVALLKKGKLSYRDVLAGQRHTEIILPMINELLDEAGASLKEIDFIGYGKGPGSFTGVRIATSVVQGLAYSLRKPVVGISTLACMALEASLKEKADYLLVASDARMGEVYYGVYQPFENHVILLGEERVCSPGDVSIPSGGGLLCVGNGWQVYNGQMPRQEQEMPCSSIVFPHARHLLSLSLDAFSKGKYVTAEEVRPTYLRNKVVREPIQ